MSEIMQGGGRGDWSFVKASSTNVMTELLKRPKSIVYGVNSSIMKVGKGVASGGIG